MVACPFSLMCATRYLMWTTLIEWGTSLPGRTVLVIPITPGPKGLLFFARRPGPKPATSCWHCHSLTT
uniref:Uncharacterized protein n=1 Tax=Hyaloperonospora arabidopsidis (strain Emoy2) TaxID=559515 RepID=M4BP56_HYAAE